MSIDNKEFASQLIGFLKTKVPNNDFDAIAHIVSQHAEKQIDGKTIYYLWKTEKQLKAWVIKALIKTCLIKGWLPTSEFDAEKVSINLDGDDIMSFENSTSIKKSLALHGIKLNGQ
tara:strand:+ start:473 stop:820 length:348 start_codon:yes stop_codon:yes gene_type:complete